MSGVNDIRSAVMKKILVFVVFAMLVLTVVQAKSSGTAIIPFPRGGLDQSFSFHRGQHVTRHAGDLLIDKIKLPGKVSDFFQDNAGWVLGVARAGEIGMRKSDQPEAIGTIAGSNSKELNGIVWLAKHKGGKVFSNHPTGILASKRNHFANLTFYFKDRRGQIYECKVLQVLPEGLKIFYKLAHDI